MGRSLCLPPFKRGPHWHRNDQQCTGNFRAKNENATERKQNGLWPQHNSKQTCVVIKGVVAPPGHRALCSRLGAGTTASSTLPQSPYNSTAFRSCGTTRGDIYTTKCVGRIPAATGHNKQLFTGCQVTATRAGGPWTYPTVALGAHRAKGVPIIAPKSADCARRRWHTCRRSLARVKRGSGHRNTPPRLHASSALRRMPSESEPMKFSHSIY